MAAAAKRGERKPAACICPPKAGFDGLARNLRDRHSPTPSFAIKSRCEALRQADSCALHTCIIAHTRNVLIARGRSRRCINECRLRDAGDRS
jgi:hypothetical protein